MRIEFDAQRDLLYLYLREGETKVVETRTITPGVHADFDREGRLIGLEVLDASETIGKTIEFRLPESIVSHRS